MIDRLIKTIWFVALLWGGLISSVFACPGGTMSTGWCWPTGAGKWTNDLAWNGSNSGFPGTRHLAKDVDADENDPVYAMDYGVVLIVREDVNFYGGASGCNPTPQSIKGGGAVVRYYNSTGKAIDVLYAHIKELQVQRGNLVVPGQVIAKVRNYTWCGNRMDHLHLGVAFPARTMSYYDGSGSGDVWAGYGTSDRWFVNPETFFASNTAGKKIYGCNPSQERCLLKINGPIGWFPPVSDCTRASQWFNMATVNGEKVTVGSTTKSACPLVCYAN